MSPIPPVTYGPCPAVPATTLCSQPWGRTNSLSSSSSSSSSMEPYCNESAPPLHAWPCPQPPAYSPPQLAAPAAPGCTLQPCTGEQGQRGARGCGWEWGWGRSWEGPHGCCGGGSRAGRCQCVPLPPPVPPAMPCLPDPALAQPHVAVPPAAADPADSSSTSSGEWYENVQGTEPPGYPSPHHGEHPVPAGLLPPASPHGPALPDGLVPAGWPAPSCPQDPNSSESSDYDDIQGSGC